VAGEREAEGGPADVGQVVEENRYRMEEGAQSASG
jgi:hypothetical protein